MIYNIWNVIIVVTIQQCNKQSRLLKDSIVRSTAFHIITITFPPASTGLLYRPQGEAKEQVLVDNSHDLCRVLHHNILNSLTGEHVFMFVQV